MKKVVLIFIFTIILAFIAGAQKSSFYDFTVKTIDGEDFPLSNLKGKRIMIVNVASESQLAYQYEQLQKLYKDHEKDNFVVIAFPANNFGEQEPRTNEEIKEFCTTIYGVNFPLMEKISVKDEDILPLYIWLTKKSENGKENAEIVWNFHKFLIDENGNWVASLHPSVSPLDRDVVLWAEGK